MKKGQIYEGIIERVDFPNKGIVFVPEEEQYVTVKNGIPGQKIRFMINKFKRGKTYEKNFRITTCYDFSNWNVWMFFWNFFG